MNGTTLRIITSEHHNPENYTSRCLSSNTVLWRGDIYIELTSMLIDVHRIYNHPELPPAPTCTDLPDSAIPQQKTQRASQIVTRSAHGVPYAAHCAHNSLVDQLTHIQSESCGFVTLRGRMADQAAR